MSSIPPDPRSPQGATDSRTAPLSSDQLLPPVEPPSAGFLLQLFVVPAIIVACVVLVWFVIESMARSGEQDPAAIISALRSPTQARFQQAKDLADMLRTPERYADLKSNRDLAVGLAKYLDELVDAGSDAEGEVTMRYILASVLGEIHVADSLPTLIKTAQKDPERDVRRKAINSIAVLASAMSEMKPPQRLESEELTAALVALSSDKDELVRSEAAFAIGVVATGPELDSQLEDALRTLADDPYTDARFNAAVALARIGSPLAPAAVAEMLDPEGIDSSLVGEKAIAVDETPQQLRSRQAYKRNTILTSALSSVGLMLEHKTPAETLGVIEEAIEKFIAAAPGIQDPSPVPSEIIDAAKRALEKVRAARK